MPAERCRCRACSAVEAVVMVCLQGIAAAMARTALLLLDGWLGWLVLTGATTAAILTARNWSRP